MPPLHYHKLHFFPLFCTLWHLISDSRSDIWPPSSLKRHGYLSFPASKCCDAAHSSRKHACGKHHIWLHRQKNKWLKCFVPYHKCDWYLQNSPDRSLWFQYDIHTNPDLLILWSGSGIPEHQSQQKAALIPCYFAFHESPY